MPEQNGSGHTTGTSMNPFKRFFHAASTFLGGSLKRKRTDEPPEALPEAKRRLNVNSGSGSQLEWLNELATKPSLRPVLDSLHNRVQDHHVCATTGCWKLPCKSVEYRPAIEKKHASLVNHNFPRKVMAHHVSLAYHRKLAPTYDPPPFPDELRHIKPADGGKAAWVASHLCHDRACINPDHLVWEPGWANRLRDNCAGLDQCWHRPFRCIRPHRPVESVNWTDYLPPEHRPDPG
ncbi:hypothetical protein F4776DRAFT_433538 [Hypoxylon sp. NC0597]|nr:hypothetical protein F4776DRAFT_433538 [Hypoxylon sp. NC0597]